MARALVVYESMWGNTELLARAVADGIAQVMPVDLTDVAAASLDLDDVTLVVVGGPTHGHSMSSPDSRRGMRCLGALHGSICTGLREWLGELPEEDGRWLATFDTRVSRNRRLPGSAAGSAAREGRRHHFHAAARPRSFYLVHADGPLLTSEVDRAREWGRMVAASVPAPRQAKAGRHLSRASRPPASVAQDAAGPDISLGGPVLVQHRVPEPVEDEPVPPETTQPEPLAPAPATAEHAQPEPPPAPAGYDPTLELLVERVRALQAHVGTGLPVLGGVAGEPGAGKSTLTASLVAALQEGGTTAVLVPMDGFHLANVALAALGRADRKGALDTFDGAGYAALLTRLRSAGPDTVWAPTYDRSLEESVANAIAVPPGTEVVVTEGNYLLVDEGPWSAVRWVLDEAWAVEVDPDRRTERLVARHILFGKPPETAAAWVATVDEPNAAFVRATFGRADLVIRGT